MELFENIFSNNQQNHYRRFLENIFKEQRQDS